MKIIAVKQTMRQSIEDDASYDCLAHKERGNGELTVDHGSRAKGLARRGSSHYMPVDWLHSHERAARQWKAPEDKIWKRSSQMCQPIEEMAARQMRAKIKDSGTANE